MHEMLETAQIKPSVLRALIFKWHKRFKDDQDSIEDDKGHGRKPTTNMTSISEVKTIMEKDRRYTISDICDITGMSCRTLFQNLTEQSHIRKVSARWVPRLLTTDHKERRVAVSCIDSYQ